MKNKTRKAVFVAISLKKSMLSGQSPEIGDVADDGTVYLGLSPDTGEPLFVAATDAPTPMRWEGGMLHAAFSEAHGHTDWRLPTPEELDIIYQNKQKIPNLKFSRGAWNTEAKSQMYYWALPDKILIPSWRQMFNGLSGAGFPEPRKNTLIQEWLTANKCDFASSYGAPSQRLDGGEKDSDWCKVNRFSVRLVRNNI